MLCMCRMRAAPYILKIKHPAASSEAFATRVMRQSLKPTKGWLCKLQLFPVSQAMLHPWKNASIFPRMRAAPYRNKTRKPRCKQACRGFLILFLHGLGDHIIPPIPPAGIAGVSSLMLATAASVVRKLLATLVAFCRALLVTFAGSKMPPSTMSIYSSFITS